MKKKARTKPTSKRGQEQSWSSVTWADLDDWAGSRAVSRGRAYQRRGAVSDLGISADGELVAWVVGTTRYATRVRYRPPRAHGRGAGRLESACSCPVHFECKHAVATVVAALERIEDGEKLPRIATDDVRWDLAAGIPDRAGEASSARRSDLASYLGSLEKTELVELLLETSALHPEIEADLVHRRALSGGDVAIIVKRIREEIADASAQEAWSNSWSGEVNLPDYSRVQSGLEQLLGDGQADAIVELGRELFAAGQEQIGQSHDDGETGMAIADCLAIVSRALPQSSLPDPEKILYAIDVSLADDYGLADEIARIPDRRWSKRTWSAVADTLAQRLESSGFSAGGDFHARYHRERTSNWLVSALDAAGREAEALQVCEDEAPRNGSYERLVRRLIEAKRIDEAREWAERGYAAVLQEQPGTASRLHTILSELARRRRQWPLVAAYEAERFFDRPEVSRLESLLAAAKKAGREEDVRKAALRFLETGKPPARSAAWPLPSTNLTCPDKKDDGRGPTKHWDVLRDLAIQEGRPDDVLRWHDRLAPRGRTGFWRSDDAELRVARSVASTHPERAIEIYRAAAERLIDRANPNAYAEAGSMLRRVREILEASGRSSEWPETLAEVRESHRRKRRLMEVLDGLEGKPIVRRKRSRS